MSIFRLYETKSVSKKTLNIVLPFFLFCLFLFVSSDFVLLFGQSAESEGRIVLLDFTGQQCPACQIIEPLLTELEKKQYPIRRVNSQNPADQPLFLQYNITSTPSFVMLLDGAEVDRYIGQGEGIGLLKPRLLQMYQQAFERSQTAPAPAPATVPAPAQVSAPAEPSPLTDGSPVALMSVMPNRVPPADLDRFLSPNGAEPCSEFPLSATVRLRIADTRGNESGTGTLIHTNDKNGVREGLILTCGHLFRNSRGRTPVEVDLFGGGQGGVTTVAGECIWYDADLDIGFVGVPLPAQFEAVRLVPPGYLAKTGDTVVSAGCVGGENPTVWEHRILSTDQKFYQPKAAESPNEPFYFIEVSNAPKQGRSGGGLFVRSAEGDYCLLGVCNAGDAKTDEGYFLPASVVYRQLLSHQNLTFVYEDLLRAQSETKKNLSAGSEISAASTVQAVPYQEAVPADFIGAAVASNDILPGSLMVSSAPVSVEPLVSSESPQGIKPVHFEENAISTDGVLPLARLAALDGAEPESGPFSAGLEEIRRCHENGAEIICIISWPNSERPKESEVIRLSTE